MWWSHHPGFGCSHGSAAVRRSLASTTMTRPLQVGLGAVLVAVAALGLPWWSTPVSAVPLDELASWHASTLLGADLIGGVPALVLVLLAVAALATGLLAGAGRLPSGVHAAVLAAAGGAAVAAGASALPGAGPWLTAAGGALAVLSTLTAVTPGRRVALALVAALPVPLVLALLGAGPQPRTAGPFVRLAPLTYTGSLRSGAVALAGPAGTALAVPLAGTVGYAGPGGLATVDPDGRVVVRAATDGRDPGRDPYRISGLWDGHVVYWTGPDTVTVRALDRDTSAQVTGVSLVTRPGPDGSVWLRPTADPDAMRRLDLRTAHGTVDAATLPRPASSPARSEVDPFAMLPVEGGLLALGGLDGQWRLRLYGPATPVDLPACVTSGGRLAADADGVWFTQGRADGSRLVHLAPDGTRTTVDARLPGQVESLALGAGGTLGLLVGPVGGGAGLWSLPAPETHLTPAPCA
ncbi:hypothetical protein SAMN05216377_11449 [Pseudonocardia oroxyli]|uniref:Uncharacterized protein n=2 Tax=Pseudonocardia oroxyli TaxID=366584 RepID=A0A1G7W9E1_PSEOR|nr:hypothetical protein SAMN05216377_11449 [Pseudonocardia oroxyli]